MFVADITRALIGLFQGIILLYLAVSHKAWELPKSRIWLAEIDFDSGLDFPI